MKKIFIIAMMAFASISANAQEEVDTVQAGVDVEIEVMTATYHKKDPMSKQPGGKKWRSEHVGITEWDDGTIGFGLLNPPSIFIGGRDFMGNRKPVNTCKVGLYTPDGEIVWFAEKWLVLPSSGGTVLGFAKSGKAENMQTGEKRRITPEDILSFLKETKGYIRFIADTYGDFYFDVSARLDLE